MFLGATFTRLTAMITIIMKTWKKNKTVFKKGKKAQVVEQALVNFFKRFRVQILVWEGFSIIEMW